MSVISLNGETAVVWDARAFWTPVHMSNRTIYNVSYVDTSFPNVLDGSRLHSFEIVNALSSLGR